MRRKDLRRLGRVLAALLLIVGLLPAQALAGDTAKAVTMCLEATEGTVELSNARGKALTVKEGVKLFSGYSLTTSAASYAWISLDEDVVVKLDAGSKATVKQNNKKLEIMLETGKLFFNVTEPLDSDASLDIRTSTMSTGVRGTSGLVGIRQDSVVTKDASGNEHSTSTSVSTVVIYDAAVTVTYTAQTAETPGAEGAAQEATARVSAGWQAEVVQAVSAAQGGTAPAVEVQASVAQVSLQAALGTAGFVAVELARDKALFERIVAADNGLDAGNAAALADRAQVLLEQEQSRAAEEARIQEEAIQKTQKEKEEQAMAAPPVPDMEIFIPQKPAPAPPAPVPEPDPEPEPPKGAVTVTFQYGSEGAVYATQTMDWGQAAVRPQLQPSERGAWKLAGVEYDFAQPVTQDLILVWSLA